MPRMTKEMLEKKLKLYHELSSEQNIKIELLTKELELLRTSFTALTRIISGSKK